MNKIKKHFKEIIYSVILGCVIGVIIGLFGHYWGITDPVYVGVFSGAATGCSIVILIENEKIMGKK